VVFRKIAATRGEEAKAMRELAAFVSGDLDVAAE
jgi:hypothetical protein